MIKKMESFIDKAGWEKVSFGDVVREVRESVKDPAKQGLERTIGLEHIESENIHIKSWGSLEDGTSFSRRFRKGQMLFGRRRAYLKKAALANFDGICSGDIIVMEAKQEKLLPELLPFLVQNEKFFDFAVKHSAGSLSPRTKFKSLAQYEFLLPPKDQQARIAELLWAGDGVVERLQILKVNTTFSKRAFFRESLKNSELSLLSRYANVSYGLGQPPEKDENGVIVIRATNIRRGKIDSENLLRVKQEAIPKGKNVALTEGDIIVVRSGAYTGDVAMITKEWEGSIAGYDLIVRPNREKIDSIWLTEYLLEDENQRYFKGESIRSAQPHLNSKQVLSAKIPLIKFDNQRYVSNKLKNFYNTLDLIDNKIDKQIALQKSLINQIF